MKQAFSFGHLVRALPWLGSIVALGLSAPGPLPAGSWTGTLQDGSVLQVDPSTHRPMRYYNGGAAPLWDGTHQLEDGSVVIVRDGSVVPTEGMMDTWSAEPGSKPEMRERYCEQLVRKVCGFGGECSRAQPCVLAQQLQRMERDEQRRAPLGSGTYPHTTSSGECLDALANPAFPTCKAAVPMLEETACKKLVDGVCGDKGRCASSESCDAARQLLRMETEERLESADPEAKTPMGVECERAETNPYFKPCQ